MCLPVTIGIYLVDHHGTVFAAVPTKISLAIAIGSQFSMIVVVPVALAICTWVYYHVAGVRELGPLKYLAHFGGAILWMAPVMFVIEIIGHVARLLSLTVRLYANMFAGEQVTNVFIKLTYFGLPVIFMGLHVFVAFLQAYIFTLLTMIYVSMGTAEEH